MQKLRWTSLIAVFAILAPGGALAFGTLVTAEGVTITASRTLVVRHGGTIQIATQVKYDGATDKLVWLLGLPNFNNPDEDMVRGEPLSQEVFDTLDQITRPTLTPSCDAMPTGAPPVPVLFGGGAFGPTAVLATSFFPAALATKGDMDRLRPFLERAGFPVVDDDPIDATISALVDQNLMVAAIIIDLATLGQDRIDPIISLRYPAERGDDPKLALRGLMPNLGEGRANLVVWVLDTARGKIGTTRDLNTESVVLMADGSSNYNDVIDQQAMAFQSQVFFTEYASAIDEGSVENPSLRGILSESGATFLTRLRARIVPAALRTNLAVATVTTQGTARVDNFHTVLASNCAPEVPDMAEMGGPTDAGPEMDMAPEMPAADMAVSADGGSSGSKDDDDDDDGGCAANAASTTAPILLLLLFLPLTLRRRRR